MGTGAFVYCRIAVAAVFSVLTHSVNRERMKTNLDAVIGERAVVHEAIDNQKEKGKVIFRGVEWMARSSDDTLIPEGEAVQIEEISGVKLVVKKM